jgi:prepilin-type N-terminal cleavage/methylation domain-containing protein
MRKNHKAGGPRQAGFSLLELMLVIAILGLIMGAVFSQLNIAQQRLSTEEVKLDDFQQARDFVDQFFRDINQIGTPNTQIMDTTQTFTPALTTQTTYSWATNPVDGKSYINDNRFAMGLLKIAPTEIWFEGSMTGDGTVQTVIYKINGNGNCSLCMQRSQANKVSGDPLAANTDWGTEVNDVITNNTVNIFRFFQYDGTEVTFGGSNPTSYDYTTNAGALILANVKTVQINLTIRNNNVMDKQTGLPIETSFEGEVSLNNCSMAATGQNMSCQ